MRAFIIALCVFLWLLLGWFLLQSNKDCCQGVDKAGGVISQTDDSDAATDSDKGVSDALKSQKPDDTATTDSGMSDVMMFRWGEEKPELGSNWDTYRNSLINGLGEGQNLEITGLYRPGEENNTTFENLGLARAEQVKKLLTPPLSEDRLQLTSRQVDDGAVSGDLVSAIDFRNFIKQENIDESIPDRTIIRFQQNSTNRIQDPEVEAYLTKVAERVKRTGESIRLTGHTDRLGTFSSNIELGKKRAEAMKSYLISKGVPAQKITTDSKGESSPIASNSTAEGRAQNRRAELQIIK